MQLYCGPSPHISYIGFPKISQDLLRFPIGFPQYIRHSHIRHSWRHSYIYDIPMAFLAACIPTACYGTYSMLTTCMPLYDIPTPKKNPGGFPYAYERHASDMPTIDMPTTCIYTACLRHAYIYDMHAYTTCMPIRHAHTTCLYIRHAYDMPTTCLYTTCLRHAYTTCLYGMPTTCLRHACLRHACLHGIPIDMHAYDMPI